MKLADKVAVVTGASRGIGRAIATLFAYQGARVAGCALHSQRGVVRLDDFQGTAALAAAPDFLVYVHRLSFHLRSAGNGDAGEVEFHGGQ